VSYFSKREESTRFQAIRNSLYRQTVENATRVDLIKNPDKDFTQAWEEQYELIYGVPFEFVEKALMRTLMTLRLLIQRILK